MSYLLICSQMFKNKTIILWLISIRPSVIAQNQYEFAHLTVLNIYEVLPSGIQCTCIHVCISKWLIMYLTHTNILATLYIFNYQFYMKHFMSLVAKMLWMPFSMKKNNRTILLSSLTNVDSVVTKSSWLCVLQRIQRM